MPPPGPIAGRGSAHGKLILCGEHAVVYGHPAIAVAVDRTTEVCLHRRPGATTATPPVDLRAMAAIRTIVGDVGYGVAIRSSIPIGRGMGSSAALSVALVRAAAAAERSPRQSG